MKALAVVVLVGAALVSAPSAARAQVYLGREVPSRGSWEAAGGAAWVGGLDFGERTAGLTRNAPRSEGPFDLFTVDSRLDPAAGVQARVGFYLSRGISLEAGFRYAQPRLALRLGDDFEQAPDTTATETIGQYVFDGSIVFHITPASFVDGRAVPFVAAGAGHVRDLHEGSELVETGTEYHAGAGLKYWLGSGSRRFGLRFEAGFSSREGGFDLEDERRTVPVVGASLIYLF